MGNPGSVSRRRFVLGSGALAGVAALGWLPDALKARGWYEPAYARDPDLVRDTLNGLVAFVLPGDDPYSKAQGEQGSAAGGIAAGTTDALIRDLDRYLPQPDTAGANDATIPLAGAVANLLNVVATSVNPLAARGPFPSPFARLSFDEKVEVFRRLEEETDVPDGRLPEPFTRASGNFAFLVGVLLPYVGILAGGEGQVFDRETRSLTGRPVAWEISGYQPQGPVEG
ncbi:MAG: hypothetical protein ACRDJF_12695, partial [Actinomycetota bacterium]